MGMAEHHHLRAAQFPGNVFFIMGHEKFHALYGKTECLRQTLGPISVVVSPDRINRGQRTELIQNFRFVDISSVKNTVTILQYFHNFRTE